MHKMRARPGPQHDIGPPQVVRHLAAFENGAVGDVARDARLAVTDDALADRRPHAVAADQRAALDALTVSQSRYHAVAPIFETIDALVGFEFDQIVAQA